MMKEKISGIIEASVDTKQKVLHDMVLLETIKRCIQIVYTAFKNGNKVLFCGNGGSAADAQHLAAEFSGRFYKDRKALPAEALHCNSSYITAVGNDYGYDVIYSRLIEGIGQQGDVLIGLSTSGNSKNIMNAFEAARQKDIATIGFTGATGGGLNTLTDHLINVPTTDTPRIQEAHIMIGHIICNWWKKSCFQRT